jgi:predicted secreted hydrolase
VIARVAVALIAGVVLLVSLTTSVEAGTAPEVRPVVLPRDHAVHPDFAVEWWYGAGRVRDRAGRGYAWFATVWTAGPGAVGRVNVVDLRDDRVVLAREYVTFGPQSPVPPLNLDVNGLRMRWLPDGTLGRFEVEAPTADGSLTLRLVPRRRYVLHGRRGIIEQGGGGPSGYYSSTRLAARGTLRLGERERAVRGEGWLDHQWGNFASNPASLRWDWFACRFADGRDLMLYRFLDTDNRPQPSYFTGTFVDRRGRRHRIARFQASAQRPFLHPAGATATYPLGWRLRVPRARLDFTIRALARNQFIQNNLVPSFWEGAARVTRGPRALCFVEDSREPLPIALASVKPAFTE